MYQAIVEPGTDSYREAARILADLRDAVGGERGNTILASMRRILPSRIQH